MAFLAAAVGGRLVRRGVAPLRLLGGAGGRLRTLRLTAAARSAVPEEAELVVASGSQGGIAVGATEVLGKRATSAAHPRRGRGPSERPRTRFEPSQWWRGWRVEDSGELGVEGDVPVASLGPLLWKEDEAWDKEWGDELVGDAVGVARVLHDSDEGDFSIREGDVVVVQSKLNPVGALGRSGILPTAWPPKRKNQRRRMIARELQRQRDDRRRTRETAAANTRKAERQAAKAQVGSEMKRRERDGELPVSRVLLVEDRLKEIYTKDEELDSWMSDVFGEEPYRPPPGKAAGVSLVH